MLIIDGKGEIATSGDPLQPVSVSGQPVIVSVSGNIVISLISGYPAPTPISGSVTVISGLVRAFTSGDVAVISGQLTTFSGIGVAVQSGYGVIVNISGQPVRVTNLSGTDLSVTANISGQPVSISGQPVNLVSGTGPIRVVTQSGSIVTVLSGLGVLVSGQFTTQSGAGVTVQSGYGVTTSVSGNVVNISGQSVTANISGQTINVVGGGIPTGIKTGTVRVGVVASSHIASTASYQVTLKPRVNAGGTIFIGTSGVTASNAFTLSPSPATQAGPEWVVVHIDNPNDIWMGGTTSGAALDYIVELA